MKISSLKAGKSNDFENLKLILDWDKIEIAKNDILHGDELLSKKELSYLMESALKKNRPGFVKLLLENKFDLKHFMTTKRLYFLYHFKAVAVSVKNIFLYINWPYLNNYLFY